MNPDFIQARIDRYAMPDYTPVQSFSGVVFERTHPMNCPHCGCVFFGFQPKDAPFAAYHNPKRENGRRQVCGHPACLDAECDLHRDRFGGYSKACQKVFAPEAAETETKKDSSLKRFGR